MNLLRRFGHACLMATMPNLLPGLALEMEYHLGRPRPKTAWGRFWNQPSALTWFILGWKASGLEVEGVVPK